MENFTPYSALAGGVLIGLSATMLLLFNGRIAGISGIFSGIFGSNQKDKSWRVLFLIGMITSGFFYQFLQPGTFEDIPEYPYLLLITGGFIVGFGTRMGGGCTSGHGVCGIGRLSKRSIIATMVFMCTGIFTVYLLRHVLELI